MAKRIEGPYDFSPHDFRKYADGAAWELTEGEDFDEKPSVIRRRARTWAKGEGLTVEDKIVPATPKAPAVLALRFLSGPTRLRQSS
jgi:hypothetical protein